MLMIVTFWWGDKYSWEYVRRLHAGLQRNLTMPHTFVCLTEEHRILGIKKKGRQEVELDGIRVDDIRDQRLLDTQGCFARLRLFDPRFQDYLARDHAKQPVDRFACIDLDCVVTGSLDATFDRPESFVILHGANAVNPCPYNGSLWMLRAGYRPDVWSKFSLRAAYLAPYHSFPDDQGWMWDRIPDAAGWRAGPESGIYAFKKPGWPDGDDLPSDARAVFFPGRRDPSQFTHLPWVQKHWRT